MSEYNVEDYDNARAVRDFNTNPPANEVGMGSDGWGDVFNGSSDSSMNDSAFGGMDLMGGNSGMGMDMGMNGVNPQQSQGGAKSVEDLLTIGIEQSGKFSVSFIQELVAHFKGYKIKNWVFFGMQMCKTGFIVAGIGFVITILSIFMKDANTTNALNIVYGGALSGVIGFAVWWSLLNKAKKQESEEPNEPVEEPQEDLEYSNWGDPPEEEFQDTYEEEEDPWGNVDDIEISEDIVGVSEEDLDIDKALEEVPEITAGTQTRQFLFETFMRVLPIMSPSFDSMEELSEGSDRFLDYEQYLQDASYQVGTKEDKIPELVSVRENQFIIQLVATRPSGLKEQEIADEIANVCSRDSNGTVVKKNMYAMVDSSVGSYRINIFKTDRVKVSLADVYSRLKEWVCDTKVVMPLIWGVSEMGTPVYCDAKDMVTLIISGPPRGGKSWKGQSVLLQLAMFQSPKEINFYFFDPKGMQSDYEYMSRVLPHSKGFVSDVHQIIPRLKQLISKEEPYRRAIMAEKGEISIKEFKKKYPEVDLPYLYVVMDELQTMMNEFSKEEKQEFNSLVSILVSQLPNLGIRLVMFPHRIVNDIINKNIYELVSCRCIVRNQYASEIQNAIGVTKREFAYNLATEGDMAVKSPDVNDGVVTYCHSEILTSDNGTNRDLFRFVGEVWKKLEPDYSEGIYDSIIQSTNVDCVTIGKKYTKKIDAVIGEAKRKNNIPVEPARDNSIGNEFIYGAEEVMPDLSGIDTESENVDESFWDSLDD